MKKTLLALAVATVSTSALAAGNIYDDGTTAFNVKGEIDTYLSTRKNEVNGQEVAKNEADIDLWAKIQIDATHKLNDDVSLFGSFEVENGGGFGYNDSGENEVKTDDLYFGAYIGQNWGVAVGEVGDFGDSLDAITIDNTNEGYGFADDLLEEGLESGGHGISVKGDFDQLVVIADAYLDDNEDNDVGYGVSAQYAFNDMFTVGASYQDQGTRTYDYGELEYDILGVAARFNVDNFAAAVQYITSEANDTDIDNIGAALSYQIQDARLYTSFGFTDIDSDDDANYYTVGADYAFSSNVLAFVEYSAVEFDVADVKDEDELVLAGVYYTF
ncbi:porin [Vibrio sp. EA2]|uniref:porin n=1 Tax=Vibrio sp. EA2 TaxID=3079860 RepID=UPI00294A27CC|nr:porin [Vibrio sp. EA2]MDV6250619.1 porin [Vibrio sp. EA2]